MIDYLKYWRVIRYFVKRKYGLSQAELEMLLFLRTEQYFSKDDFDEFDELLSWDKNVNVGRCINCLIKHNGC